MVVIMISTGKRGSQQTVVRQYRVVITLCPPLSEMWVAETQDGKLLSAASRDAINYAVCPGTLSGPFLQCLITTNKSQILKNEIIWLFKKYWTRRIKSEGL